MGYIDTVRHARDYRASMLLPRRGFFIELCVSRGGREGFQLRLVR